VHAHPLPPMTDEAAAAESSPIPETAASAPLLLRRHHSHHPHAQRAAFKTHAFHKDGFRL